MEQLDWYEAGTGITIYGDTISKTSSYGTKTAYGSQRAVSGIHRWELEIIEGDRIKIGISSNTAYLESSPWYERYSEHTYNGSDTYSEDDIVEVCLDLNRYTLHYIKNGKKSYSHSVSPYDINKTAAYRLTVSLSSSGDSVRLSAYDYIKYEPKVKKSKKKGTFSESSMYNISCNVLGVVTTQEIIHRESATIH